MTQVLTADVAVIGGGIAGASAAAEIARERSVVLLEREDQPGYHTSGRSAALFSEAYGNGSVRGLSVASREFLEAPPDGFAEHPLLTFRGALHVGTAEHLEHLAEVATAGAALVPSVRSVTADEARAMVPALRPEWVAGGVFEPEARDIDTNAVLQGYLKLLRARGGRVVLRAGVKRLDRVGGVWRIVAGETTFEAATVVNAAGAWADATAALAGAAPLGLQPMRRTAFLFAPPDGLDVRAWPLVIGADEDFYFKPDAGLLLGSLAEEAPSEPTEAQPDDYDVAVAVDRINGAADLPVRRIVRSWAGLRTFAPDRTPVVGYDPAVEGFFWVAGQGGYGFQTAPAMAASAAALLAGRDLPAFVADRGVRAADLAPGRFG